jgi:DNA-binding MarR family transcriptional regulator
VESAVKASKGKAPRKPAATPAAAAREDATPAGLSDRDLAVRLGSVMLCVLGGEGGAAVRVIDESGLTFTQTKALMVLARRGEDDEPTTVSLVAERVGVSIASASRAVDGLVRRELATRVEDPDDRRIRRISLTQEGHDLADEMIAARMIGIEAFVSSLTQGQRRKLAAALESLLDRDDVGRTYDAHRRRLPR